MSMLCNRMFLLHLCMLEVIHYNVGVGVVGDQASLRAEEQKEAAGWVSVHREVTVRDNGYCALSSTSAIKSFNIISMPLAHSTNFYYEVKFYNPATRDAHFHVRCILAANNALPIRCLPDSDRRTYSETDIFFLHHAKQSDLIFIYSSI